MSLETVEEYVEQARVLLQDTIVDYRYADTELLAALNLAVMHARKLRPDLFLDFTSLPTFSAVDSTEFEIDEQYRLPFLYFMVGYAQLRDEENTQDARSGALLSAFNTQLLGIQ